MIASQETRPQACPEYGQRQRTANHRVDKWKNAAAAAAKRPESYMLVESLLAGRARGTVTVPPCPPDLLAALVMGKNGKVRLLNETARAFAGWVGLVCIDYGHGSLRGRRDRLDELLGCKDTKRLDLLRDDLVTPITADGRRLPEGEGWIVPDYRYEYCPGFVSRGPDGTPGKGRRLTNPQQWNDYRPGPLLLEAWARWYRGEPPDLEAKKRMQSEETRERREKIKDHEIRDPTRKPDPDPDSSGGPSATPQSSTPSPVMAPMGASGYAHPFGVALAAAPDSTANDPTPTVGKPQGRGSKMQASDEAATLQAPTPAADEEPVAALIGRAREAESKMQASDSTGAPGPGLAASEKTDRLEARAPTPPDRRIVPDRRAPAPPPKPKPAIKPFEHDGKMPAWYLSELFAAGGKTRLLQEVLERGQCYLDALEAGQSPEEAAAKVEALRARQREGGG